MKKAIFQLSMRCEVMVEKLTQGEIDKYTKRNFNKNEERGENGQNPGKRKFHSILVQNKKQKISAEESIMSVCGSKLQNGSSFVGHEENEHYNAVNIYPAPEFSLRDQNKANVLSFNEPKVAHSVPSSVVTHNVPIPSSVAHNAPSSVTHNTPSFVTHNAPSSVAHNAPSSVAHNAPSSVAHNAPSSVAHNAPSSVAHNAPSSVAHNAPSSVAHNAPSSVAHNAPRYVPHNMPYSVSYVPNSVSYVPNSVTNNVPSCVAHLQKNGIIVSSSDVDMIKRNTVGSNISSAGIQNSRQINRQHSYTGLQAGGSSGAAPINSGNHETVEKKRGRQKKMPQENIQSSGLESKLTKGKQSPANEIHKTWGRSVSLDIKPSNNPVQLQMAVKEMNNNKVSLKPSSTERTSSCNVAKKSYTVMHTSVLQPHNKNNSPYSTMLNDGAISRRSTEDTHAVNLPPGVTLIRHGTQSSWPERTVPIVNGSNAGYSTFDRTSSTRKEQSSMSANGTLHYYKNTPNHRNLPSNGSTLHHNLFLTDKSQANSVLQSYGTNAGGLNPAVKTEVDINNPSFMYSIQENSDFQLSAFDIPLPEFLRTSLDMPDISDAVLSSTPKQVGKRCNSETHAVNNFVQLPRRHSLNLCSDEQLFVDHQMQQQKENVGIKCRDFTQTQQISVANIVKDTVSQVQNDNSVSITNENNGTLTHTLPRDLPNSITATHHTNFVKCAEEKEKLVFVQNPQNSPQNVSDRVASDQSSKDFTHIECEDNLESGKCRETKRMSDINLPRSKCVSRRHSASSSSSHSSLKEKIMLLFGDSDEDIEIDPNCPSPENFFRRISNKNINIENDTEVDKQNSMSSAIDKVDVSNTCKSNESLISGDTTLNAENLVQLDLSNSDIDRLFPSAADNEGGNSDKIQILPHHEETISCHQEAAGPCDNQTEADSSNSVEMHSESDVQHGIQQICTTNPLLSGNDENGTSSNNSLQLQCRCNDISESAILTQVEHSSADINEGNESVTTSEKTEAELLNSAQQQSHKHIDSCTGQVTDIQTQSLSSEGVLSSQDSCIIPASESNSSNSALQSQLQQPSELSDSTDNISDTVQSPLQPGCEVSRILDVAVEDKVSSNVSQALESSKVDESEVLSDVDCSSSLKISSDTNMLPVNDAGTNMPSDVQMQPLESSVCTETSGGNDVQLPQVSENSIPSESITDTTDYECPSTELENAVPPEEQNNQNARLSSHHENTAPTAESSSVTDRPSEIEPSLITKNIISEKEVVYPNLPLKHETDYDNCDKNVNNSYEVEDVHSQATESLPFKNVGDVTKETLNSEKETLPTELPVVDFNMDDLIVTSSATHNDECSNSVSQSHTQEVGAVCGNTNIHSIGENNLEEERVNKGHSQLIVTDQSWPEQNILSASSTGSQIVLNAHEKYADKDASMNTNVEPGIVNPSTQNPFSQIGTIRVRDVNSLVEPAAARVPQSVLNSLEFKEFAFIVSSILGNRSRCMERLKAVQSVQSEYSEIEKELALREYYSTAFRQEISFTNFITKNSKNFGAFTRDLRLATLSRIESEYGQKYSFKHLDVCLNHLDQLKQRREKMAVEATTQGNKLVGSLTSGKSDGLRQWETDSTNSATHSQYRPGVNQEPVNVLNRIHPNYGNYQRSSVGLQSQLHLQSSHVNAVENSNIAEVPTVSASQVSVLGSLLTQEGARRALEDALNQYPRNDKSQAAVQLHRTVHSIGETNQHGNKHFRATANEVCGTRGSNTYQNRAPPEYVQQHQQNETHIGYRNKQELYQSSGYRPTIDRTSVICQANEQSRVNPVYVSNQMDVANTAMRKEATSVLAHNLAGKNQNMQNPTNEALLSHSGIQNPAYSNNEMAVSGGNTQNVGQVIVSNGNVPQSIFIDQLHYTVNRYTAFSGTPVMQPSHSTVPTPQAYKSNMVQHQVPNLPPSYTDATQLRQVQPASCTPFTQQFERSSGQQSVSQQLRNIAVAQPVDQTPQQLNNGARLVGSGFYVPSIARKSQNLQSNPYQIQNSSSDFQCSNPANVSQVQSNTFQQYSSTSPQQYNGLSNQQLLNFRQNVAQSSYHQNQISNQQYSNMNAALPQHAVVASYQLKGPAAPNVSVVPNSNHQLNMYSMQNAGETMKRVAYGQSSGSTTQKPVRINQQQSVTSGLQSVMPLSGASKSEERALKRVQRTAKEQHSVSRTANSYVASEHQAVQLDTSLAGYQQHQQYSVVQSAPSVPAQVNYAATSSPGFVHPPEVLPPVEQVAAAADSNIDDVILVYEQRSNEPRTVSRDSGYTTPSPRVATTASANLVDSLDCHEGMEVIKTEKELKCVRCGKTAREVCSACRSASYCSKLCQLTDWETSHYAMCNSSFVESETTNAS